MLGSTAAKGDAIRTRMEDELSTYRYDDPLLYKKFSLQVQETLSEYKTSRNDDRYLLYMERIAEDFKRGYSGHSYPACIENDSDAKAFYGSILEVMSEAVPGIAPEMEAAIGQLAIEVKKAIAARAKIHWRSNVPLRKSIDQAIDDLIWDFIEEHGILLPVEKIDLILDGIMKTAMSRY